jgi:uncharacterized surface protein with fasciclin (FAS1) repeats
MKPGLHSLSRFFALLSVFIVCLVIASCKREPLVITTSDQVTITGYLDKYPARFSEWRKVLEITKTAGFLQAYGTYTMFVPTNEGVEAFLKANGKASVEEISPEEWMSIVKFSLLEDTISTSRFTDGKLDRLTMHGQYLITGVVESNGTANMVINRQANVLLSDVRLGNGIVHVIDNILSPAKLTVAETLASDPAYSIFVQGLKETGLFDSLNILPPDNPKENQKFLTLIAESDQVLSQAGFSTYDALKAKYNKGNPDLKDPANGLHKFFTYHILYGANYIADLAIVPALPTLTPTEIIAIKLDNQQVVINDQFFNGEYEPGTLLERDKGDISASNGVLHTTSPYPYSVTYTDNSSNEVTQSGSSSGHFDIKVREPFPVYWDVADFPEARRNPKFRTSGAGSFGFSKTSASSPSPIEGWNWPKKGAGVTYTNAGSSDAWVNRDYLNMFLGRKSGNARQEWIEMRTPLIVRGRYHVWVCYRRQNQSGNWPARIGTQARVRIDGGEPSSKSFFFAEPIPNGTTKELESLGWKYYTSTGNPEAPFALQTLSKGKYSSPWIAKDLGIMDIKTTDFHTLLLEALEDSQSTNNLDMIHFIPVDAPSQILPRFMKDGTPDYTDYP